MNRRSYSRLLAAVCATGLTAAVPEAGAQPADGSARKAKVAVFVVAAEHRLSTARRATLLLTMEKALARDRRLEVVDKDRQLAARAGQIPEEAISEARGLLRSGEALLQKNKPKQALIRLQTAEAHLRGAIAWVKKQEFARAQFLLGVSHAMLGRPKAATTWFTRLQIWRPDFVADTSIAPAKVLPLWEATRRKVRHMNGGSIELHTRPDGALAYVDGRFLGFTPTTAEGLTTGNHYVTLKMVGYSRTVLEIEVSAKQQHRVRTRMEKSEGVTKLRERMAGAARQLGDSRIEVWLDELGQQLGVQHAVFVRVPSVRDDDSRYEAFLYDIASGMRIGAANAAAGGDREVDALFRQLARSLYSEVVFAKPKKRPVVPIVIKKQKRKGPASPFYKKWWFWTGVSVVAAGAAAVPIVMSMDSANAPQCPTGSVCGDVIFDF